MACGSCGNKGGAQANRAYVVTVAGTLNTEGGKNGDGKFSTTAEARIWIASNVKGVAATVRAIAL